MEGRQRADTSPAIPYQLKHYSSHNTHISAGLHPHICYSQPSPPLNHLCAPSLHLPHPPQHFADGQPLNTHPLGELPPPPLGACQQVSCLDLPLLSKLVAGLVLRLHPLLAFVMEHAGQADSCIMLGGFLPLLLDILCSGAKQRRVQLGIMLDHPNLPPFASIVHGWTMCCWRTRQLQEWVSIK